MRTIIESHLFEDAVKKLGGAEEIDKVLGPIIHQIALMPTAFSVYKSQNEEIRIAYSKAVGFGRNYIPPLRLFFRIPDLTSVELLYVEPDPNQDG